MSEYLYKGDGLIAFWDWHSAIRGNKILRAIDGIFATVRREHGEYCRQFAAVHNNFNVQRHLTSRNTLRILRGEAFQTWQAATAA
jgi:hypothetical protein